MRTLTVSKQQRQWGDLDRLRYANVPAVHLSGRWLEQHGFTPGVKINVRVESGALILEIAK